MPAKTMISTASTARRSKEASCSKLWRSSALPAETRAQTALDEGEERNVSQRRNDRADDGSDEPGKRQIHHAVAPSFREKSPVLQDAGDDGDHRKRKRQEHFPAQPHELVVAVARHDRLHHGEEEEHE